MTEAVPRHVPRRNRGRQMARVRLKDVAERLGYTPNSVTRPTA